MEGGIRSTGDGVSKGEELDPLKIGGVKGEQGWILWRLSE